MIVPFIACFWWRKANRAGALTGMFGGLGVWGVASQFETWLPPDLIGFLVSLVGMIVVTQLTQGVDPPRPLTDADGNNVELTDRLGRLRLRD